MSVRELKTEFVMTDALVIKRLASNESKEISGGKKVKES